jgi:uncharacterized membrane protein
MVGLLLFWIFMGSNSILALLSGISQPRYSRSVFCFCAFPCTLRAVRDGVSISVLHSGLVYLNLALMDGGTVEYKIYLPTYMGFDFKLVLLVADAGESQVGNSVSAGMLWS